MGVKLIVPPSGPVLTLTEAKAHLRVTYTDEDDLIAALVTAATNNVEQWTGRALVDQTWDLYLDAFPTGTDLEIRIPKPPLISVTSFVYDNSAGVETTVDPSEYYVDSVTEPGWVVPVGSSPSWPTPIDAINSVRIRFRAGYMTADSPSVSLPPEDIRAAVKLLLGSMYENREDQVTGTIANRMPWGVEQLLRPHRVLLGMA